jgi:hypothetical protein
MVYGMGADAQKRPLVVTVGCNSPEELRDKLGIETPFVDKLAGGRVLITNISGTAPWWSHPERRENMHHLLFDVFRGKRTPNFVTSWIKSDKFIDLVRRELLKYSCFAEHDTGDVMIVIIGRNVDTDSEYVRRVFDGLFPNADHYEWHASERLISPIWRDAEVTPIVNGAVASASPAEVLDWPASQLSGLPKSYERWAVLIPRAKVENLVSYVPSDLRRRGASEQDIQMIEGALSPYGLGLGMTSEQIDQIKRGLVPTTPIPEIGRYELRESTRRMMDA